VIHRILMRAWLVVYDFAVLVDADKLRLYAIAKAGMHANWDDAIEANKQASRDAGWDV
jgi:hypothetical protein